MFKGAFIFVHANANPKDHFAMLAPEGMIMAVYGCPDYVAAEELTRELVNDGYNAIELCGGFGNEGVARIQRAAGPDVYVGAIRFDRHPSLAWASGDKLF